MEDDGVGVRLGLGAGVQGVECVCGDADRAGAAGVRVRGCG